MANTNGYVINGGIGMMDLDEALRIAAEESRQPETGYRAMVEDCDTQKVIARFSYGEEE